MLLDLHVKNLALIERAEISFEEGLNILTGETGAGKSIIIGSVNMALGGKVPKDIIRQGAEYAYVELIFRVTEPEKIALLQAMDVELPEGEYPCIAYFDSYRIKDSSYIGRAAAQITVYVLD